MNKQLDRLKLRGKIAEEIHLLFTKYVSAYSQKTMDICVDKFLVLFPDIEEAKKVIREEMYQQLQEVEDGLVERTKKQERERIIVILEDYGAGDKAKSLVWAEFEEKYGTGADTRLNLVDVLRQAIKEEK